MSTKSKQTTASIEMLILEAKTTGLSKTLKEIQTSGYVGTASFRVTYLPAGFRYCCISCDNPGTFGYLYFDNTDGKDEQLALQTGDTPIITLSDFGIKNVYHHYESGDMRVESVEFRGAINLESRIFFPTQGVVIEHEVMEDDDDEQIAWSIEGPSINRKAYTHFDPYYILDETCKRNVDLIDFIASLQCDIVDIVVPQASQSILSDITVPFIAQPFDCGINFLMNGAISDKGLEDKEKE